MGLENLDEMPSQKNSGGRPTYTQAECFEAVREFVDGNGYYLQSEFNEVDEYPNVQTIKNRMEADDPSSTDVLQKSGAIDELVAFKEPNFELWNPGRKNQLLVQRAWSMIAQEPRSVRDVYYGMISQNLGVDINQVEDVVEKGRRAGWIDPGRVFDTSRRPTQAYTPDSGEVDEYVYTKLERLKDAYFIDWWEEMDTYVEVWVEKASLEPVFKPICKEYNVPLELFSGYWSDSRVYRKCGRLIDLLWDGTDITILYFGDFNTNGLHIPVAAQNVMRYYGLDLGRDEEICTDSSHPAYFDIWPLNDRINPGIYLDRANMSPESDQTNPAMREFVDLLVESRMEPDAWQGLLDGEDFSKPEIEQLKQSALAGTIRFERVALIVDQVSDEFSDLPQNPNPGTSSKSRKERQTFKQHITGHLDDSDVNIELNALKEYYRYEIEDMLEQSITKHLDEETRDEVIERTETLQERIDQAISVDDSELMD